MKRPVSFYLMLTGAVFVFGSLGWLFFLQIVTNPTPVDLPKNVAGLPVYNRLTGAQAASDFTKLHGKQILLTSGAVGIYGDHEATLWVAGPPFEILAARMVTSMQKKIADGKSPFTPVQATRYGNRTVYELNGMGQTHFYFQSGKLVIWLAVNPEIADLALQQTLEFFP